MWFRQFYDEALPVVYGYVPVDGSQVIGFASNGGEVVLIVEQDDEVAGSAQGMGTD